MKIQLQTVVAVAACCAVGAFLAYVLTVADSRSLEESPAVAASAFQSAPAADHPLEFSELAAHPAEPALDPRSGDILDAAGQQRWRGSVELAPVGAVVIPQGASKSTPRRRVGVRLRDGVPMTGDDEPFTYGAPAVPAPPAFETSGGESPSEDASGQFQLAPTGADRANRRSQRSESQGGRANGPTPDGLGSTSSPSNRNLVAGPGLSPGQEAPPGRAGRPAAATFSPPATAEFPNQEIPLKREWPKGNFTREQQLLRTQIGWQAFAQWVNEQALQEVQPEPGDMMGQ